MSAFVTLAAIAALAIVYVLVPIAMDVFSRYRARRQLRCPHTGLMADVELDARHAAFTAIPGPPDVRVRDCSLWPDERHCDQACASRAA